VARNRCLTLPTKMDRDAWINLEELKIFKQHGRLCVESFARVLVDMVALALIAMTALVHARLQESKVNHWLSNRHSPYRRSLPLLCWTRCLGLFCQDNLALFLPFLIKIMRPQIFMPRRLPNLVLKDTVDIIMSSPRSAPGTMLHS
jgi:hypothetical protein